ncbi:MAG: hypothetical protein AB7P33_17455 [Dehalococcoidia bacterium]
MDEEESQSVAPAFLTALLAAAAFVLIAGLLGYSLVNAVEKSDTDNRVVTAPRATATNTRVPFVYVPSGTPEPRAPTNFYIFILCDGETVQGEIYSGNIDSDYVVLMPSGDRDVIVDVLANKPTIFPPQSKYFTSACARRTFNTDVMRSDLTPVPQTR